MVVIESAVHSLSVALQDWALPDWFENLSRAHLADALEEIFCYFNILSGAGENFRKLLIRRLENAERSIVSCIDDLDVLQVTPSGQSASIPAAIVIVSLTIIGRDTCRYVFRSVVPEIP